MVSQRKKKLNLHRWREERWSRKKDTGKEGKWSNLPLAHKVQLEKDAPQRGYSPMQTCTVRPAKFGLDLSLTVLPWLGHLSSEQPV